MLQSVQRRKQIWSSFCAVERQRVVRVSLLLLSRILSSPSDVALLEAHVGPNGQVVGDLQEVDQKSPTVIGRPIHTPVERVLTS